MAADKLNDQTVIAEIAKEWILSAVEKLTDQTILIDIAENHADESFRIQAAKKIENSAVKKRIYADVLKGTSKHYENENSYIKSNVLSIFNETTDQNLLIEIAEYACSEGVRIMAAERITDKCLSQKILADIAANTKSEFIEYIASQSMANKGEAQSIKIALAKKSQNTSILKDMVREGEGNQQVLAVIATRTLHDGLCFAESYYDPDSHNNMSERRIDLRYEAMDKLTSKEAIAYIAQNTEDADIRKKARDKLNNL